MNGDVAWRAELGPWEADVVELVTEVGETDSLDPSGGPSEAEFSRALDGCKDDAVDA